MLKIRSRGNPGAYFDKYTPDQEEASEKVSRSGDPDAADSVYTRCDPTPYDGDPDAILEDDATGEQFRYDYGDGQCYTMGGDGMSYYSYGKDVIPMRGYESEDISSGGNLYAKYTFELRYPAVMTESATIYGLAFLEGGNCWKEVRDFRPFDIYRSAGAGVRVYLPMLGMLGLDWGWGFDVPPGQTEKSGSVLQFTLGQNF